MPSLIIRTLTVAAGLALAACAIPTSSREPAMLSTATSLSRSLPVKQWPLKFKSHSFGAHCYSTYGCRVVYAGLEQRADDPDELRPSSSGYGADYQRNWSGTHAMIRNFPPPAQVSWRSKDGQAHTAEIDIGELFADEVIRHNVKREEMADLPNGEYKWEPAILLEINDRTIRVYMRAMIFLKKRVEVAGQLRGDFRNDLILVKSYNY
jgi:hypothetical protein